MRVRPIFIVALCLAIFGGVLALALRAGNSRYERPQAAMTAEQEAIRAQLAVGRPYLPEAIASIDSLRLHRGVRRFTMRCPSGYVRCYLVMQPPRVVAPELPGLLRSIGADPDRAIPAYRSLASVNGCRTSPVRASVVTCAYQTLLDRNEVGVVLGPHFRCGSNAAHCQLTGETEILFTVPGMSPATST